MLAETDAPSRGYLALHQAEAACAEMALLEFGSGYALWCRILNVFLDAVLGEHDFTAPARDQAIAAQLRLASVSLAAGTSKAVLDLCMRGAYTQGYALMRPVLEAWKLMVYLATQPSAGETFFATTEDGLPRAPDRRSINRAIREHLDSEVREAYAQVQSVAEFLNDHVHPSAYGLGQTASSTPGVGVVGAHFNDRLTVSLLDVGTFGSILILQEFARTLPSRDVPWVRELGEIVRQRDEWLETRNFPPGWSP